MMCEADLMDQEFAYLDNLGAAKRYLIVDDQLILSGSDGTELAKYKAQRQDLAGTSWQVLSYNNGKGAVTSVLNDTTITAEFSADGTLQGSSSSNTYQGTYETDKNQIRISSLAATKQYSSNLDGIMEQETQYLQALHTASKYLVEGNSLEIRTEDEALVASFTKNH